jgi:hypothetical protein
MCIYKSIFIDVSLINQRANLMIYWIPVLIHLCYSDIIASRLSSHPPRQPKHSPSPDPSPKPPSTHSQFYDAWRSSPVKSKDCTNFLFRLTRKLPHPTYPATCSYSRPSALRPRYGRLPGGSIRPTPQLAPVLRPTTWENHRVSTSCLYNIAFNSNTLS